MNLSVTPALELNEQVVIKNTLSLASHYITSFYNVKHLVVTVTKIIFSSGRH